MSIDTLNSLVQSAIAVAVTAVFLAQMYFNANAPPELIAAWGFVVGYYFKPRSGNGVPPPQPIERMVLEGKEVAKQQQ